MSENTIVGKLLVKRFINIIPPLIDARSILKSWRKMPTVSLPKGTMEKTVRVQVPEVLPAGKILGSGWYRVFDWRWCAQSRRLEVVRFVGTFKADEIGRASKDENDARQASSSEPSIVGRGRWLAKVDRTPSSCSHFSPLFPFASSLLPTHSIPQ